MAPRAALAALRAALAPRRHLAAGPPRLAQADGDGLLAALDLPTRTTRAQLAALHLVHCALHLLAGFLAVAPAAARSCLGCCHVDPPCELARARRLLGQSAREGPRRTFKPHQRTYRVRG